MGIYEIVADVSSQLEIKNEARDRALLDSRKVVRYAANSIRALHRGEYEVARQTLSEGSALVRDTRERLAQHPDIYWAGYVQDSQKEIAEAHLVAAMIQGELLPGPETIGVENAPFLNGLAEAASEMRRYILDRIRSGGERELQDAERVFSSVDDVYTSLITVDFPDAITGGLRRTVDALRAVLERTRGDLTLSVRQAHLARALQKRSS